MNNYVSFFHTMLATNTVSRRNVNPDRRIHSLGFRRTEAEFMGNIGPQWVCDVNAVDQTPCGVRATEVCVPTVCGTRVTDATPDQLAFSLAPMKDKDIVGRDDSVSHDLSLLAAQMLEMGVHNAWDEMSDIIMRLKEDPTFELTPAIVSRAAVAPGFPPTAQAFWDVISNSTNQPTRLTYDDITQLDQTGTPMVYYFVWVYSACIRFRTGGSSRLNTPIEVETTTRSLASKFPAAVAFIATVEGMSCHDYMLDLETLIVGSRDRNCPFRAERSFDPAADTPPPAAFHSIYPVVRQQTQAPPPGTQTPPTTQPATTALQPTPSPVRQPGVMAPPTTPPATTAPQPTPPPVRQPGVVTPPTTPPATIAPRPTPPPAQPAPPETHVVPEHHVRQPGAMEPIRAGTNETKRRVRELMRISASEKYWAFWYYFNVRADVRVTSPILNEEKLARMFYTEISQCMGIWNKLTDRQRALVISVSLSDTYRRERELGSHQGFMYTHMSGNGSISQHGGRHPSPSVHRTTLGRMHSRRRMSQHARRRKHARKRKHGILQPVAAPAQPTPLPARQPVVTEPPRAGINATEGMYEPVHIDPKPASFEHARNFDYNRNRGFYQAFPWFDRLVLQYVQSGDADAAGFTPHTLASNIKDNYIAEADPNPSGRPSNTFVDDIEDVFKTVGALPPPARAQIGEKDHFAFVGVSPNGYVRDSRWNFSTIVKFASMLAIPVAIEAGALAGLAEMIPSAPIPRIPEIEMPSVPDVDPVPSVPADGDPLYDLDLDGPNHNPNPVLDPINKIPEEDYPVLDLDPVEPKPNPVDTIKRASPTPSIPNRVESPPRLPPKNTQVSPELIMDASARWRTGRYTFKWGKDGKPYFHLTGGKRGFASGFSGFIPEEFRKGIRYQRWIEKMNANLIETGETVTPIRRTKKHAGGRKRSRSKRAIRDRAHKRATSIRNSRELRERSKRVKIRGPTTDDDPISVIKGVAKEYTPVMDDISDKIGSAIKGARHGVKSAIKDAGYGVKAVSRRLGLEP